MALIHCNFFSEALRSNTDINVIIPTPHPVETPLNPGNFGTATMAIIQTGSGSHPSRNTPSLPS